MKLTLKTLKQVAYEVEVSESASVKELKKIIETQHGFDSTAMKLLYNAVVLDDEKTLSAYNMKDGSVIVIMNAKAKPMNVVKEEKKKEEALPTNTINNTNTGASKTKQSTSKSSISKPIIAPKDYTEEVKQLVEMGFGEELSKQAMTAAKGDIQLAIEFLYNGIPSTQGPQLSEFLDDFEEGEDEEYEGPIEIDPEVLNNINLNDPNALPNIASIIKVIINDDPSQLQLLLEDIEEHNPDVIDFIKEHESEFKNLLEKPITPEDVQKFNQIMPQNNDLPLNEEEELTEGIHNFLHNEVNFTNSNPNITMPTNLAFSQTEKEAIERLKGLGFSEMDVVQAYVACDKNEEITANFLFENKYKEGDMNIDCKK
jgi:UV excision repair protein RAD23